VEKPNPPKLRAKHRNRKIKIIIIREKQMSYRINNIKPVISFSLFSLSNGAHRPIAFLTSSVKP
jgi:hypothetical protein